MPYAYASFSQFNYKKPTWPVRFRAKFKIMVKEKIGRIWSEEPNLFLLDLEQSNMKSHERFEWKVHQFWSNYSDYPKGAVLAPPAYPTKWVMVKLYIMKLVFYFLAYFERRLQYHHPKHQLLSYRLPYKSEAQYQ
jgi:hypothetical protein